MKRLLSFALSLMLLLSCFAFNAAAGSELPFELVPPGNLTASWLGGNDSPTTTKLAYTLSNEMTEFFKQLEDANLNGTAEELLARYDCTDFWITTQVDWAVDDVNDPVSGWHCNEYWNGEYGFGYDEDYVIRVGEWDGTDLWVGNATETVNELWVLRYVSEDALNGDPEAKRPGLKDQLRPDQYEYRYNDEGDGNLYIDFNEHTVYFRMRFVLTKYAEKDDGNHYEYFYSEWSNIASIGKDAEQFKPITKDDLPAPVITGLRMTDEMFNDNPVVAFTLAVPDELAANAAMLEAFGGYIFFETFARVKGDSEWTMMQNTSRDISAGERSCALLHLVNDERPNIPKDTIIELRCRYFCSQPEQDDIYSDWSKIISFGTDDISQGGEPGPSAGPDVPDSDQPDTHPTEPSAKCPICHFCPQPLGLCIFIWLAILIVIVVIVIIILRKKGKKNDK